jgi:hypothetical protein
MKQRKLVQALSQQTKSHTGNSCSFADNSADAENSAFFYAPRVSFSDSYAWSTNCLFFASTYRKSKMTLKIEVGEL